MSGGRRPPEALQAAAPTPFHLRVDQRDELLRLAGGERLVGSTDRLNAHGSTVSPSAAGGKSAALASSSLGVLAAKQPEEDAVEAGDNDVAQVWRRIRSSTRGDRHVRAYGAPANLTDQSDAKSAETNMLIRC